MRALTLSLFCLYSCYSFAVTFNEAQVYYYKCYSQMTGEPPTFDHTDLKKIKSIEDAKKACVSLLDSVSHIKTKNEESKKVLNRFHELHQEWFLVKERINVSHSLSHSFMLDTYDGTEPALYFTKTLFDNSSPFHSVVTSNEYYKARRSQGPALSSIYKAGALKASEQPNRQPPRTEIGELTGIKIAPQEPKFKHFGAGLLGSQTYLLTNVAEVYGFQSDGTVEIPRLWAASLYKDMLCRFLPVIHHKDVRSSDVYPQSTVPFRKSSKCLLCHSSTDPLAGGLRNFVYVKSPFDLSQKALNSEPYYTSLSQTHRTDPEDWKPEKTPNFYTSHPHGRLYYRNINNSLKEEKYNSLNELGEILSQQIDLYYCFVSRYKNYLIGESTTISNFNRKDSYFSKASHKMTMKLAQELMVHQDIKKTIKDIISLPEYLPTSNTEKVSQ